MLTTLPAGAADALLAVQVHAHLWLLDTRARVAAHSRAVFAERDERGDVYSHTIMTAITVIIAITVGGILLYKFQTKANSIDTNTPTGGTPTGGTPTP